MGLRVPSGGGRMGLRIPLLFAAGGGPLHESTEGYMWGGGLHMCAGVYVLPVSCGPLVMCAGCMYCLSHLGP